MNDPFVAKEIRKMLVELRIWRRWHPTEAGFVYEEADATIEGRQPKFGPPIIRGTAAALAEPKEAGR